MPRYDSGVTAQSLTVDFSRPMPMFPLRQCALLPHATIPLHVFEMRYRSMVRDVLDGSGLIVMAVFDGESWREDYLGNPPVRDHVCVGYVVRHNQLPDGRYNILLQGVCRAKINEELDPDVDGYRRVMVKPTETQPVMEIDLGNRRERLEMLINDPTLRQLAAVSALQNLITHEVPTAALVDLAILTVCNQVEDRYLMLAEADSDTRAAWLEKHLADTRTTLKVAERFGPGVDDDGWHLN